MNTPTPESEISELPTECTFKILAQGGPILNTGWYLVKSERIVAIEIDMASKRCSVFATSEHDGIPVLYIGNDGQALYLKDGLEKEATEISFPEHKGWELFTSEISRYTLRVCLVKP